MSTAARTALAAAAEKVEGISCSAYFRQTTKAGDAMVRLDRSTRSANGYGFVSTWQVLVILPQDIASAEKQLDTKLGELVEALGQEMHVSTVTPQQLQLDTGAVPVVVIEGTRETETE